MLDVQEWTDYRVLDIIRKAAEENPNQWSPALALQRRGDSVGKHSVVYQTNYSADVRDMRHLTEIVQGLEPRYPDCGLWIDLGARGPLHRFYLRGDQEELDEFPVVIDRRRRRTAPITEESAVLGRMPKQFWVIRVYARGDRFQRDQLREAIAKEVRERT